MFFRYCTNAIADMSKSFAKGLFIVGLLLMGFGVLVYALKEIFAAIAAAIFLLAGAGCCYNAIKVFFAGRAHRGPDDSTKGRENVRIHYRDEL